MKYQYYTLEAAFDLHCIVGTTLSFDSYQDMVDHFPEGTELEEIPAPEGVTADSDLPCW